MTPITALENILFSNLRCMKMRNTNEDLTAAIMRAIVTVIAPREICVSVTEVRVSAINPANTYRNVL
jgi:NADPH-dependent 7-cyano-7-deazaguanine reductase QueF